MIVSLNEFSPVIGDVSIADRILHIIKESINNNEENVTIDFTKIRVIATNCAKHIFGKLYIELGSELFFSKIVISNASENVKASIMNGIEAALHEN